MDTLNKSYWNDRYLNEQTGWDIGHVSTPIKAYIDQLENKELKILIPGAGNAWEAEYLHSSGFSNVHVLDISPAAIKQFVERVPEFPREHIHEGDFFQHDQKYDLILEQTFFCALDPKLRNQYALKMHELLNNGAKLVGLLFNFPLTDQGPPFGGSQEEYHNLFKNLFDIQTIQLAHNSIAPRQGNELFIQLIAK